MCIFQIWKISDYEPTVPQVILIPQPVNSETTGSHSDITTTQLRNHSQSHGYILHKILWLKTILNPDLHQLPYLLNWVNVVKFKRKTWMKGHRFGVRKTSLFLHLQQYHNLYLIYCTRCIFLYLATNQFPSPLTRVRNLFMVRCTQYIMWWSLSVTCDRSVVFYEYSGFLHQ